MSDVDLEVTKNGQSPATHDSVKGDGVNLGPVDATEDKENKSVSKSPLNQDTSGLQFYQSQMCNQNQNHNYHSQFDYYSHLHQYPYQYQYQGVQNPYHPVNPVQNIQNLQNQCPPYLPQPPEAFFELNLNNFNPYNFSNMNTLATPNGKQIQEVQGQNQFVGYPASSYSEEGRASMEMDSDCENFEEDGSATDYSDKKLTDSDPDIEDEDEDLDFENESDGSNAEDLVDHLGTKFRSVLDDKIAEAELFFDQMLLKSTKANVDVETQTELETKDKEEVEMVLGNGDLNASDPAVPSQKESEDNAGKTGEQKTMKKLVIKCQNCLEELKKSGSGKDTCTQTDDASASALLASMTGSCREEPDCARLEIANLRDARMSLVNERKILADNMKKTGVEESVKLYEKQLYELEEAIEAIDTAIEYKNEIICGQQCILSNHSAPGEEKADLVTRLASLSVFDLQRLLCKYFSKVVELRFSSRKLEKGLEKMEEERAKLRRRHTMDQKSLREKDDVHEARIKHLLSQCIKNPAAGMTNYVAMHEAEMREAEKRLKDFQLSLTELLIRHGYLLDGADYHVKDVVKILGIQQMGMNFKESDGKRKDNGSKGETGVKGRGPSSTGGGAGPSRISQRRNAQTLSPSNHPPGFAFDKLVPRKSHYQPHYNSTSHHTSHQNSSHGNTHHHQNHHQHQHQHGQHGQHSSRQPQRQEPPEPFSGTEVRREKKKLIIQPPPSSSH